MSIDAFYLPTRLCWRMPASRCFVWRSKTGTGTPPYRACAGQIDSGMDGLSKVLRKMIRRIDDAGRNTPHQISIARSLI